MGRTASAEPQCLYNTAIPLFPLGPYGLCRASVPVQYSYTSIPTSAVRPVQTLSDCIVHLYLYSTYGPYGLYRPSMPVEYSYTSTPPMGRTAFREHQCLYSTDIPLIPLWAVGLCRASGPLQYSCTSIPSMGSMACADPQCLYSTAITLFPLGPYGLCRASVPVQ